jgi:hypothetical protein
MIDVIPWDGQPISKPGVYSGVPMSAYHGDLCAGPSVSRSGLWTIFDKSPRHYWRSSYLNPLRIETPESEAFLLGRAAHHALLGEKDFASQFVVRPDTWDSWRTKDAKAWREKQQGAGFGVLIPDQIEQIKGMAGGLAEDPLVRMGVLNGLIEHTIAWQDEETGVWLKVRPDSIPTDGSDIADLKTAADISDDGLESAIGRDGLNVQGALIGRGVRSVMNRAMNDFTLVFIEKTEPFCCRCMTVKPADIALGELQARVALDTFARCIERGTWPGPGGTQSDAAYIEIKPYERGKIERRIAVMQKELSL